MNEDRELQARLMAQFAAQTANRPRFFGNVIARYAALNNLDDGQLCAYLGCDVATLNRLRACYRPDPDPASFAIDIRRIADGLGLAVGPLVALVREVDLIAALGAAPVTGNSPFSATPGLLAAARDHDEIAAPVAEEPEVETAPEADAGDKGD